MTRPMGPAIRTNGPLGRNKRKTTQHCTFHEADVGRVLSANRLRDAEIVGIHDFVLQRILPKHRKSFAKNNLHRPNWQTVAAETS